MADIDNSWKRIPDVCEIERKRRADEPDFVRPRSVNGA